MANMNLLRGGYKQLTMFLRPYSTVQSSFMGRSSAMRKSSVLFTQNAQSTTQLPQAMPIANVVSQIGGLRPASSATTAGPANANGGSSIHWNVERYLSVALLAIIPGSLLIESSLTDHILAASLVLHSHWGLQNILTDYIHGPTLPKMANGLLYVFTALTFAGLCYFNYSDIGLSKAIKKIWSL